VRQAASSALVGALLRHAFNASTAPKVSQFWHQAMQEELLLCKQAEFARGQIRCGFGRHQSDLHGEIRGRGVRLQKHLRRGKLKEEEEKTRLEAKRRRNKPQFPFNASIFPRSRSISGREARKEGKGKKLFCQSFPSANSVRTSASPRQNEVSLPSRYGNKLKCLLIP